MKLTIVILLIRSLSVNISPLKFVSSKLGTSYFGLKSCIFELVAVFITNNAIIPKEKIIRKAINNFLFNSFIFHAIIQYNYHTNKPR